ncbi:MAG: hypothetical protein JNG89_21405, partial [Planctomycetaceae bacterium]|nr:hypothetical protein [Planctomycetaceae bacterium]
SYHIQGFRGCGAWTAGSSYTQVSVEESRAVLQERINQRRAEAASHVESEAAAPGDGDARPSGTPQQDDERRRERRRRMQQRESERQQRDGDERWDGDEPRGDDSERG